MNDPPMGTTKREAVLDAALELFEERTFYGTAMPLVAARAGVGAGTIYRHFESKEVLANELFRFWKDGLTDFTLAHPTAFAFLETHRHQPYLDADSRAIALALDSQIERFIRRHQRTGDLRSGDPAELIALVLGAFVGLVRAAGDGRIRLTRRRLRAAAPRVWHLIGPPMR
jgi:AcrR family transcriptional regulator